MGFQPVQKDGRLRRPSFFSAKKKDHLGGSKMVLCERSHIEQRLIPSPGRLESACTPE